jgi:YesN/AraC family two-component response regulator
MSEPIRILIVEDQTLIRQGLKTILDLEPGLAVAGEAADGEEGVRLALRLRPDVILMDIQMPKLDGMQAIGAIREVWPEAKIVILTTSARFDGRMLVTRSSSPRSRRACCVS